MNRGFVSIALIIAALVVVAVGAGGWWYVNQPSASPEAQLPTLQKNTNVGAQAAVKPAPTQKTPPQPNPTPVQSGETANWKTYRNESYGFEFKHPTEYRNDGLKEGDYLFDAPQLKSSWPTLAGSLVLSKAVDPNREGAESVILRIFSNPQNLAIRDWLKTDEAIKQVGRPDTYLTLTVKNISGNEFLIFNPEGCSTPCKPDAYFVSGGYAYQLVTTTGMEGPSNGLKEDANKILSTFKFTR